MPDHSTFSRNRHGRFRDSDILRRLFEAVVERCLREGLVGGDGFAVDASLIAADANKHRSLPSSEWKTADIGPDACRAAREYLATLDDAAFGAASDSIPKFVSPSRDHCRCGGDPRNPAGRGRSRPNDDRSLSKSALAFIRRSWPQIAPMGQPRCWAGLFMSAGSSHTSRCSTSRRAPTGPSNGRTLPTTRRRCVLLPGGQDADVQRDAGERRRDPHVSRQQVRL